jgi:hypothetical protein
MSINANSRLRIIVHGAVILLVGLACGIPSVLEAAQEHGRMWQAAHSALLMLGVWLLATAAIAPLLVLGERESAGLVWSMIITGYSFAAAVIIQAITGERAISPDVAPLSRVAFGANLVAVLGAFVAASLTLMGALAGSRATRPGAGTVAAAHTSTPT